MQQTLCEKMGKVDELRIGKFYQQDNWLPHITLAKTLSKEQMRVAFETMQDHFVPIEASVVSIGLSKVKPYKEILRYKHYNIFL